MIYDQVFLAREASKYGFIRDTYEKVLRLIEVLRFLNEDSFLCNKLALKGGTAINLLFFELPRLSVDIDLDYTINNSREEMMEDRNIISEIIIGHMINEGYSLVSPQRNAHSLDQFVFKYQSSGGAQDNLKIEINYSLRSHILDIETIEKNIKKVNTQVTVRTVHPIEIFAAKINALLSRSAARDLYDIVQLIDLNFFNEEEKKLLSKLIVFYKLITNDPSTPLTSMGIESVDQRKIKRDLIPVISSTDKFELVRAKIKVIDYIKKLGVFDYDPKEFTSELKNGTFDANDIFGEYNYGNRGNDHPMIQWRIMQYKSL